MPTDTTRTTARKSTTKKATAQKSPAKESTTRKSPAKKGTTGKATAGKTASRNSSTANTSTAARSGSARGPAPLQKREPRIVLEDAGYAATGVLGEVIDRARHLPTRVEHLWSDAQRVAKDAPKRARSLGADGPARLETQLTDLRKRVTRDTGHLVSSLEKRFDEKAREGREVADRVRQDERVATVLERTSVSRSQVKAAVTSMTRVADVAVGAARGQLGVARSQAKGAVTSVSKTPDAARTAGREQAGNARVQAKAAVTSVRKSVGEVADAVSVD